MLLSKPTNVHEIRKSDSSLQIKKISYTEFCFLFLYMFRKLISREGKFGKKYRDKSDP